MENKDQRLEIRLPQQQLTEIDDIIASVDSGFKLTRSDVVRSFIAQGIDRHYGRSGPVQDTLPLGQRISLFFQLCQLQRMACLNDKLTVSPIGYGYNNNHASNTVTAEALVRQVYLQRMTWFFMLDAAHLKSIHDSLDQDMILSLMNPEPSPEICNTLEGVMALRDMFLHIRKVLDAAEEKLNEWDDQQARNTLARIHGYAKDNDLPLAFSGYPGTEDFTPQIEMYALLNWIDNGEGGIRISDYGLSLDRDLTGKYAVMLEVYQNIRSNQPFDLNGLEQMVKSRQFYML